MSTSLSTTPADLLQAATTVGQAAESVVELTGRFVGGAQQIAGGFGAHQFGSQAAYAAYGQALTAAFDGLNGLATAVHGIASNLVQAAENYLETEATNVDTAGAVEERLGPARSTGSHAPGHTRGAAPRSTQAPAAVSGGGGSAEVSEGDTMPFGDPSIVDGASSAWSSLTSELGGVRASIRSTAAGVRGGWQGAAADAFGGAVDVLAGVFDELLAFASDVVAGLAEAASGIADANSEFVSVLYELLSLVEEIGIDIEALIQQALDLAAPICEAALEAASSIFGGIAGDLADLASDALVLAASVGGQVVTATSSVIGQAAAIPLVSSVVSGWDEIADAANRWSELKDRYLATATSAEGVAPFLGDEVSGDALGGAFWARFGLRSGAADADLPTRDRVPIGVLLMIFGPGKYLRAASMVASAGRSASWVAPRRVEGSAAAVEDLPATGAPRSFTWAAPRHIDQNRSDDDA